MKKMILLGHSDGGVPIVMDLAFDQFGCKEFDVVKNLDLPNCRIFEELYQANFVFDKEYDFEGNSDVPIQFGVHNSPSTFILFHYFQRNYGLTVERFLNLVHSSAYVASSASLSTGIMIEPMAVISSLAILGFGVTVKRSASVGHHSVLGEFVHINPGATLSGFVEVGQGTVIGSGAVVSNNIKIGKKCLIGAGSVVTKDIPDGVIAFGNPCKPIRENDTWAKAYPEF